MIERYTNKKILRPCPPFGYASLRVACGSLALATPHSASPVAPWRSLRLTPRRLWLLGARYARTPVAFGSLRVGCASLPSARLRTLRVACGSLAWPSAKSVGAPPQLPTHVLADPRRRRRLRLPGRPIALSRNPSNSAMSAESDFRSIGIPVFSQPCTEYR